MAFTAESALPGRAVDVPNYAVDGARIRTLTPVTNTRPRTSRESFPRAGSGK
jgi:hypothetical protein